MKLTAEDKITLELYTRIRHSLNSLSPCMHEDLVYDIRCATIDTAARLQGVVELVYERSVRVTDPRLQNHREYARLCKALSTLQVPVVLSDTNGRSNKRFVNFHEFLISRAEMGVYKVIADDLVRYQKLEDLEQCKDPIEKIKLQEQLEEYEKKVIRSSTSEIRFFGELFLQDVITVDIIMRCFDIIISNESDKNLKYLVTLLTIVGKKLEIDKGVNLTRLFITLQHIVNQDATSSNIKFNLQDLIELRRSNWIPSEDYDDIVEDQKTIELYRKVSAILNRLVPEKFSESIEEIKTLEIYTASTLQGLIELVYDMAINKPNASLRCALLCKELALLKVPSTPTSNKEKRDPEFVNFRNLLAAKCQMEFEKNSAEEVNRSERQEEIDSCVDLKKKNELQSQLDEDIRRHRKKSVGNIRFIGELFRQKLLTVKIILRYLDNLLASKDELRLECLCILLLTVGKEIEVDEGVRLPGFECIKDLLDKNDGSISNGVRYMMQDVVDLWKSNWGPKEEDILLI